MYRSDASLLECERKALEWHRGRLLLAYGLSLLCNSEIPGRLYRSDHIFCIERLCAGLFIVETADLI